MVRYGYCPKSDRFLVVENRRVEKGQKEKAEPVTGGLTLFSDVRTWLR